MTGQRRIDDAPSIVDREITSARPGERLSYAQLTGREKRDYLFDEGIRPTAYANLRGEKLPDVEGGLPDFIGSAFKSYTHHLLSQTITRVGDELETPKRKLFHTYGTTAKIVLTPKPAASRYTGLFTVPAPGLARLSYAGPVLAIGIVPGLGLKFPIDGDNPSADLVVMRMLDSQRPFPHIPGTPAQRSVFQNPFTNFLPDPNPFNLVMREVKHRFETVVVAGEGLHQTVESLARVCPDGSPVPAEQVATPYRLILRPTAEATAASDPTIDFRDDLATHVPAGMPIYDVLALDESEEVELRRQGLVTVEALLPNATEIGTITTESEFIASTYGDYRLFFRHSDRYLRAAPEPEPS
jgi:hypothetical protein